VIEMGQPSLRQRYGRVLVVDDDPEARVLMQAALERRGFEVIAVESGTEALAYLARGTASLRSWSTSRWTTSTAGKC
jgi:DNA-binding NtrC family response regulator